LRKSFCDMKDYFKPIDPRRFGRIVAQRVLTDAADPKKESVVTLGMPRRVSPEEWQCPARVEGLKPKPILGVMSGIDALQALLLAVEFLRLQLSGRRPAWVTDSVLCTAGGIPRQVPANYGEKFDKRVSILIEREKEKASRFRAKILRSWFLQSQEGSTETDERAEKRNRRIRKEGRKRFARKS
jgi:hypothetical protein